MLTNIFIIDIIYYYGSWSPSQTLVMQHLNTITDRTQLDCTYKSSEWQIYVAHGPNISDALRKWCLIQHSVQVSNGQPVLLMIRRQVLQFIEHDFTTSSLNEKWVLVFLRYNQCMAQSCVVLRITSGWSGTTHHCCNC